MEYQDITLCQHTQIFDDLNQYFEGKLKVTETLTVTDNDPETNSATDAVTNLLNYSLTNAVDESLLETFRESVDLTLHAYVERIEKHTKGHLRNVSLFKSDILLKPPTIRTEIRSYLIPNGPFIINLTIVSFATVAIEGHPSQYLAVCPMLTTVSTDPDMMDYLYAMTKKYEGELEDAVSLSAALEVYINKVTRINLT